MSRTEALNREELINAIWLAKGKVSLVAEKMGVSARTIFNYAEKYKSVQDAIDDAREAWDGSLIDLAEVKLLDNVRQNRPWAVKFALITKGKSRGYVERQELAVDAVADLSIDIKWADRTLDE
jgi:hypothetical protein